MIVRKRLEIGLLGNYSLCVYIYIVKVARARSYYKTLVYSVLRGRKIKQYPSTAQK